MKTYKFSYKFLEDKSWNDVIDSPVTLLDYLRNKGFTIIQYSPSSIIVEHSSFAGQKEIVFNC